MLDLHAQNHKEDLRTRRTKKFLSLAFIELLEKDSMEKISVQDICDKAMVHRTTFYKHFNDKYDLFTYILERIREELFTESDFDNKFTTPQELYMQLAGTALDFIERNRTKLLNVIKNNSQQLASEIFYSTMEISLRTLLERTQKHTKLPLSVVSNFFTGGFTALAIWWLYNPQKVNKTQLLEYIKIIINENMRHI